MTRALLALMQLMGVASGLRVGMGPSVQQASTATSAAQRERLSRRDVATGIVGGAAALSAFMPFAAFANTQPMYEGVQEGFDAAAEKRKAFMARQKEFKKEWRKQLANLEFSSDDAEALDAITKLRKLIILNGNEIPEGVRKQDMDQVRRLPMPPRPLFFHPQPSQPCSPRTAARIVRAHARVLQVYRTVQPRLVKETRMEFKKLDQTVLNIVTVKSMGDPDNPL